MSTEPVRYQCRHIFTDGHRCASPCLRQQELCYYHHTTRKPVANPRQRRNRQANFQLPLPEDQSAIQASLGEVLRRIAANDIDPRRAGLLLYGLQIASLNLPKPTQKRSDQPPATLVEEVVADPTLGNLAPRAEFEQSRSFIGNLLHELRNPRPIPAPTELPSPSPRESQPLTPTTTPATVIPTLQAVATQPLPPPRNLLRYPRRFAPTDHILPRQRTLLNDSRTAQLPFAASHRLTTEEQKIDMTLHRTRSITLPLALAAILLAGSPLLNAQEGAPTQALVSVESKTNLTPTPDAITLKVDNHVTPLTGFSRVIPAGAQIALLIDDGLRESVGRELGSLRNFITSLPAGTQIFVGYMQNGRVLPVQDFTTDYAAAAKSLRVPLGMPGLSASPYFCVTEFLKEWRPVSADANGQPVRKARFILMITDGVDPYNGSVSMANQNSPYVDQASNAAQITGVPIYSIYFADAGIHGGAANFSGQSYLSQIAEASGGRAYYEGTGNPVSMVPFLKQFQHDVSETYIASFNAPGDQKLVRIKVSTKLPKTKLTAPQEVRPGILIGPATQQ